MRQLIALTFTALTLTACSPELIKAVLSQVNTNKPLPAPSSQSVPSAAPSGQGIAVGEPHPSAPCAHFLVAVRWGKTSAEGTGAAKDWAGSIRVDNGLVRLVRPIKFEEQDKVNDSGLQTLLKWNTHTGGDYDGLLALVTAGPNGPEPVVTITSPVMGEQVYPLHGFDGIELRLTEDGQQFEMRSKLLPPRPDACRDFSDPAWTSHTPIPTDDLTVEQNKVMDDEELALLEGAAKPSP